MGPDLSPTTPWACVARPCGRGGSGSAREQMVFRGAYCNRHSREETFGHDFFSVINNKDLLLLVLVDVAVAIYVVAVVSIVVAVVSSTRFFAQGTGH